LVPLGCESALLHCLSLGQLHLINFKDFVSETELLINGVDVLVGLTGSSGILVPLSLVLSLVGVPVHTQIVQLVLRHLPVVILIKSNLSLLLQPLFSIHEALVWHSRLEALKVVADILEDAGVFWMSLSHATMLTPDASSVSLVNLVINILIILTGWTGLEAHELLVSELGLLEISSMVFHLDPWLGFLSSIRSDFVDDLVEVHILIGVGLDRVISWVLGVGQDLFSTGIESFVFHYELAASDLEVLKLLQNFTDSFPWVRFEGVSLGRPHWLVGVLDLIKSFNWRVVPGG
jgi:hypothetical protein